MSGSEVYGDLPEDLPLGRQHVVVRDPERAADWQRIRGEARVPIVSDEVEEVLLPGIGAQWVYFADLDRLNPEQRARLIDVIAERFHLPRPEVDRDLDAVGLPVLERDTVLFVHGVGNAKPRRRQRAISMRHLI